MRPGVIEFAGVHPCANRKPRLEVLGVRSNDQVGTHALVETDGSAPHEPVPLGEKVDGCRYDGVGYVVCPVDLFPYLFAFESAAVGYAAAVFHLVGDAGKFFFLRLAHVNVPRGANLERFGFLIITDPAQFRGRGHLHVELFYVTIIVGHGTSGKESRETDA